MDIDTPSSVFDAVRRAVKAHVEAETKDFTGESSVNVVESDEPMKLTMSVWWRHCYNGDPDAVSVFGSFFVNPPSFPHPVDPGQSSRTAIRFIIDLKSVPSANSTEAYFS